MVEFRFKRTDALSEDEIRQLCELFSASFAPDRDPAMFRRQFLGTPFGYSYHGLMLDGARIVGSYSAVPYRYRFDGRETVFLLSVDTVIEKDYRGDPWNLVRMSGPVYDAARADGIPFAFCFPNESIYLVRKKILQWRDIGRLSYYALPVSMRVKWPALSCLDPLLRAGAGVAVRAGQAWAQHVAEGPRPVLVEKVTDAAFVAYRYSFYHRYSGRGDGYVKVELPWGHFVYRRECIDGIDAAFLVDVYPLTAGHLADAVRRVFAAERNRVSAILYIGNPPFRPRNLLKVPLRLEPKPVYMTGKILIDGAVDDRVFALENWCVNLANYEAL